MARLMYGLVSGNQLTDTVNIICKILGNGANNKANLMLLETARAETNLGKTTDTTKYAGMGITQIDQGTFFDIQDRISLSDKEKIKENLDIEIDWIKWEDLRYNILLAFLFARLKYKKIPEQIPKNVEGRALYWKKYYNSYDPNAKGTVGHYLDANKKSFMA